MVNSHPLTAVVATVLALVLASGAAVAQEPTPTEPEPSTPGTSAPMDEVPVADDEVGDEQAEDEEADDEGEVDEDAPRLEVEERVSVSQVRHLGVTLSGRNLPAGVTATLQLDGTEVRDVTTTADGTVDGVRVRFPGVAAGEHVLSLVRGGDVLASLDLEVQDDFFEVTATPRWITAETLGSTGTRLLIGAEHSSETTGLDFEAFVVHRAQDGSIEEVPLGRAARRADGSVQAIVRGGASVFPSTTNAVCLRSDFLAFLFACTELRLTTLTIARSDDGRTVTGTGFEPGSDVALVVDGEPIRTARAQGDATVRFDLDVLALDTVSLRSPAGEASLTVPPLPADLRDLAESIQDRADLVTTIRETGDVIAPAVGEGSVGRSFSPAQTKAMERQILAQEKLFGPFPAHQSNESTTDPGPIEKGPGFGVGPCTGAKTCASGPPTVDVGRQIGIDVDGLQQARGKEADAEASRAAAEAEEAKQRADDVHAQTMESLDAMLQKIITFLKELQQAEVDAMRAFTRASTPTVVARQVVGAGEVVLVDVPAGFRGRHHVVVIDPASGLVTAVQPFDVAAAAGDAGEDASDTAAALPDTGAQVGAGLVPLGVVLLLLGAASLVVARRGRAS